VKNCDLSDILPEDVEERIKSVAEMSMGTEITEEDVANICYLCDQVRIRMTYTIGMRYTYCNFFSCIFQVVEITEYRSQLYDYLKSRMMAVAPNLTVLLGEFVGARLIAQAGNE
jgi:nucleolar protein 58